MTEVALLLPDAQASVENRSALCWLRWAVGRRVDVSVVTWTGGELFAAFSALAPTVDASAVNREPVAKALGRARLAPAARVVKNQRLRRLLAPAAAAPQVLVGGTGALVALDWLSDGRRRTTVQVWASDLPLDPSVRSRLDRVHAVVAQDEVVAETLGGLETERIGLLVDALEPTDPRPGVAVVGMPEGAVTELVEVARAVRRARLGTDVHWVRRDHDDRWTWALFGEARNVDLAGGLHSIRPDELAGVDVVLVAGRADPTPALAAELTGVPVVSVAGAGTVGEVRPDLEAAAARVSELVGAGSGPSIEPARDHDVELRGARLLDVVRGG